MPDSRKMSSIRLTVPACSLWGIHSVRSRSFVLRSGSIVNNAAVSLSRGKSEISFSKRSIRFLIPPSRVGSTFDSASSAMRPFHPPLLISSSLSSLFLMLSGLFRLSATSAGDLSPFRSPDAATTGHFGTRVRGLFFAYLRFGDATSRIFSTSLTKQSRTVHVWGNANTTPSEQRLHNNAAIFCASRQKCNCYRAGMPA